MIRLVKTSLLCAALLAGSAPALGQNATPGGVDQAAQGAAQAVQGAAQSVGRAADVAAGVLQNPGGALGQAAGQALGGVLPPGVLDRVQNVASTALNLASGGLTGVLGGAIDFVVRGVTKNVLDIATEQTALARRVAALELERTNMKLALERLRAEIEALRAENQALSAGDQAMRAELAAALSAMHEATGGLAQRLAALEREKGVVTAPFRVVAPDGRGLATIDEAGARFFGAQGGVAHFEMAGAAPSLHLLNGQNGVQIFGGASPKLALTEGGAEIFALTSEGGEGGFRLEATQAATGLLITKGGQPAAGLGSYEGRPIALRVFAGGATIGAMGENPKAPGTGVVYVGNGARNAAALAVDDDGSGLVHAFAPDGTVGAGLVGKERLVAAYNAGGAAVATLQKSEQSEGGAITARDPGGDGVFRSGYRTDIGGGEACVIRNKRGGNIFCLGLGVPGVGLSP